MRTNVQDQRSAFENLEETVIERSALKTCLFEHLF